MDRSVSPMAQRMTRRCDDLRTNEEATDCLVDVVLRFPDRAVAGAEHFAARVDVTELVPLLPSDISPPLMHAASADDCALRGSATPDEFWNSARSYSIPPSKSSRSS